MRTDIHPKYYPETKVTCACGEEWTTGSTVPELRLDICSNCHPFYTGEQRIVDTEGQVERFYKRLEARQKYVDDIDAAAASKISPERPLSELDATKRTLGILEKAGMTNVGQLLANLEKGDQTVLDLDGLGRKSLADLKKSMRRFGYEIPEKEEAVAAAE